MAEPGVEARVAARWWADKLRDDFELDPRGPQSVEAVALAAVARDKARSSVDAAGIDRFEAALAREAQTIIDKGMTSYFSAMEMSTDYGPGPALGRALEEAGLPSGATSLPWKTTMWLVAGSVRVYEGGEIVELPLEDGA